MIAGRLAGAFRNTGRDRIADDIVKTMTAAGYAVRENDPFTDKPSLVIGARETSPYVNRLRLLWQKMREPVIERFPKAPGPPRNIDAYLKRVNDAYVTDAYHSLSIEGYRVTPALIERVRGGTWNPEADEGDREQRNAMAARGYWQAFQAVQKSLGKILNGKTPGEVADADHGTWYRELFAPSVTVGLLKPADLGGLPQRPGLHPQVYACAAEPGRGEGRDAGVLRPSARRTAPGRPRGARALHLRLHPSLYGWQRPRRALPDEHDDGVGRIPVDGHSGNRPQRLRERSRKSECRRGYRALRGLPRRAGEKTTGGRALAGGAESVVIDERQNNSRSAGVRMYELPKTIPVVKMLLAPRVATFFYGSFMDDNILKQLGVVAERSEVAVFVSRMARSTPRDVRPHTQSTGRTNGGDVRSIPNSSPKLSWR